MQTTTVNGRTSELPNTFLVQVNALFPSDIEFKVFVIVMP